MRFFSAPLLLILVASTACRGRTQAGPRIDPALATMTPETAVALVGVRMDKVRETPIYKRQVAARNLPEVEEFARRTGLDPRTDIFELLFVYEEETGWVSLVRGRFSPDFGGLEPRVLPGAPRRRYAGYTIIGDEQAATAFVNSSTAVAGNARAVRAILDRRNQSRGIPPKLRQQMNEIPPAAPIWSAWLSMAAFSLRDDGDWVNLARLTGRLRAGWLAVQLRDGAELAAAADCPSEPEAMLVSNALGALAGLARLTASSARPEFLRFYDSLRIGRNDSQVRLSASAPPDVVDKLIPMIR